MVFSLGVLCYKKLSTFFFSIFVLSMGFALQMSEDRYEMYWTQLQVASFEKNFLEEPSFLLSSFGIVVHMLKLVYHFQY